MSLEELKQAIESNIMKELRDGIEVNILQQRNELLELGVEFATIVANEKLSGRVRFGTESEKKLQEIRNKYNDSIREMDREIKLHNFVVNNPEKIEEFLKGWLSTDNIELARFHRYIAETVLRKELDEEKK